ncbi:hypothetical protein VTN96DRAFT_2779 [Rasamsonia emersonii]|uniref:Uncharacterized protein n=1 Tax=Rasamsonia emersonii (strain ATCC 16479 / CBS 393.64 / IMI 116815) TaxID=1408163 RepID=A0A0F4YEA9_RASE3|nr:hypothetical protein T310_9868 [Rasamsonia emersonii CBS 393.64]KKA16522.1 hypothetical protein T310_9868 [Rasamsonia emersonii CBS 393.64]
MIPKLDELPTLVLSLIFDDIYLSSPKTLRSLSLVNKACYHAAVPFLYRNLALQISSRQKLREDSAELEENPFRKKFLIHARCLKVWGRMPLLAEEEDTAGSPSSDREELAAEPAHSEEYDAEFGGVFTVDLPDGSAEEVSEAWNPLALVIQKCKHITDLIWVCRNQLPPCLLQTIDQYHPSCRLDMRSFRLRSLGDSVTDPHELDLIRSPRLHSISVKTVGVDSNGNVDYNRSAIFQVVALAPNLRHLNIVRPRSGASPQLLRARNRPRVPWKGFVPPLKVSNKGALTSLTYFGNRGMKLDDIREWPKYTDLSKIRYLMLGDVSDPLVFGYMTQNVRFASLETLDMGLKPTTNNRDLLVSELESLMEHLEPLKEVRLAGYLTASVLDRILQRHGPTLRRLALHPYKHVYGPQPSLSTIRSEEVRKIESHCPLLEHLRISIPYPGVLAPDECDLSDVCPNLHRLRELALDVDNGRSDLPLDEAARKIWDLIDKEKGGCRLSCLHIVDLNTTTILARRDIEGSDEVELDSIDGDRGTNQRITERFHGLPTARFRF